MGEFVFQLPQFRTEAGGYYLASLLPLGNKFLLVTNQYGAFVINASGDIAEGWKGGNWSAVQVRGDQEVPSTPEVRPWSEGPMTVMLARSESNGSILMTFWRGPFTSTVALISTKLKPIKMITFVGETPTAIEKAKKGWRVTLLRNGKSRSVKIMPTGKLVF
jgi:hypothetical protein